MSDNILLTPSATARVFAERGHPKSEGWVRYAALNGKLPCVTTSTGRRLFKKSDVESFIAKMKERTEEPAA